MNILEIKKATIQYLENLTITMTEAFADDILLYGEPPYGNDPVSEIVKEIKNNQCFVFIYNNEIIGGMYLVKMSKNEYRLKRIWLSRCKQNIGIGSKLLKEIELMIIGAKKIALDTPYRSYRNQYFYEKNGYKKIGEKRIESNELSNLDKNFTLFEFIKEI